MNGKLIDRIYRALFVYTIGFHELIKKCLTITASNFGLVSNIWKVFSLLLEHSFKGEFNALVGECIIFVLKIVIRKHKEEIDNIESDYTEELAKIKVIEEQLAASVEDRQKYISELEKERNSYIIAKKKMELEIAQANKAHDEEVQLRLRFENKLNAIYSAYRSLQNRVLVIINK